MAAFKETLHGVEEKSKKLLRRNLISLLPRLGHAETNLEPSLVNRILAVRQDARLGNLILLTPALRLIKEAFPQARLDVLISGRYGDALKFNPRISDLLTLKDVPLLRFRGYDLAFDFSSQHAFSLSSAVLTAWSGAPRRVGFDRGEADRFLNDRVPVPDKRAHETANLASLVRHSAKHLAWVPDSDLRTEWHFGPGEIKAGEELWRQWGLDSESVALFLGARGPKRLPPAWFLEMSLRLGASGRRVALCGGPAERKWIHDFSWPDGVRIIPELPLRLFAASIRNARAVLSADTGPMHLCVALGVPTVELFSHTEPWRFGYGHIPHHRVLETPGRLAEVSEAWELLASILSSRT